MNFTPNTADIWHTTIFGLPALQAWQDFMLWEIFLNEHPAKGMLEIGTWNGGTSLYLALQSQQRGIDFHTLDWQKYASFASPLMFPVEKVFLHRDVWLEPTKAEIKQLTRVRPFILFCDGGNKPKEFQTFGPMLAKGDYLAVHDYGNEFTLPDIGEVKVEFVMQEACENLKSLTRFFVRV